jgi:8-oxo-dGTP pyrophosphatase MutT (NUDIX family)
MEPQTYKIYFNEGALIITDSQEALRGIPNLFYIGDDEIHKSFNILVNSDNWGKPMTFGLMSPNPTETFREFALDYTLIQAAGGLVFNKENQLLCIKRNGLWDLPKGKIEKHEDQRAAALREVMEETGINMINISDKIGETYHAYREEDSILLKETHWYKMNSSNYSDLKPQTEEGISEVKFESLNWFESPEFQTYKSVRDIIQKALISHKEAEASV